RQGLMEKARPKPTPPATARRSRFRWGRLLRNPLLTVLAVAVGGPILAVAVYRFAPPPLTVLMVEREFAGQGLDHRWVPLAQMSPALPRAAIAAESWRRHGAIIVVRTLGEAAALIDRLAPEHLQLAVKAPEALAKKVRHAGAIFLGRHAPEALGDYLAGPNHVLPTSGTARFSSGLGVYDFLKRTSLIGCEPAGLARLGPATMALAEAEGLEAHRRSIAVRLEKPRR
ncbi:MAG: histidinol dehydrogenase, partial [Alphaproteobacteria bacterium]|nr:histidinol dehydrogenase [Alphaproteobacteria bacterium]